MRDAAAVTHLGRAFIAEEMPSLVRGGSLAGAEIGRADVRCGRAKLRPADASDATVRTAD